MKCKRSAARDALEGQLRPLELTSPSAAQRHDLHSPKVGVSVDCASLLHVRSSSAYYMLMT